MQQPITAERRLQLGLAGLIGVALAGFLVGVRAGPGSSRTTGAVPTHAAMPEEAVAKAHGITPARKYKAMAARGANSGWKSDVAALAPSGKGMPKEAAGAEAVGDALADRAIHRAYDGAPPVVPHPVQQRGGLACLACHAKGVVLGEGDDKRVAPAMSHKHLTNCTQCHVESVSAAWGPQESDFESGFVGVAAPTGGPRAYEGAPPQVPHPHFMRENCASCHGPSGRRGLQTSHFGRQSCSQCHASAAEADQRRVRGFGPAMPR